MSVIQPLKSPVGPEDLVRGLIGAWNKTKRTIQGQTPVMQKINSLQADNPTNFAPLAAISPIETGIDALISKDRGGLMGAISRGGDIPGALMSRGMSEGVALPLGMLTSMLIPGAGELSQMRKNKVGMDKGALYSNPDAKKIADVGHKYDVDPLNFGVKDSDLLNEMAATYLKIPPKELSQMGFADKIRELRSMFTPNQEYAYNELPGYVPKTPLDPEQTIRAGTGRISVTNPITKPPTDIAQAKASGMKFDSNKIGVAHKYNNQLYVRDILTNNSPDVYKKAGNVPIVFTYTNEKSVAGRPFMARLAIEPSTGRQTIEINQFYQYKNDTPKILDETLAHEIEHSLTFSKNPQMFENVYQGANLNKYKNDEVERIARSNYRKRMSSPQLKAEWDKVGK